jgi:hypothetical protein
MSSSIPAVKAALVSILTTALPNTQVIYGPVTAVTTTTPRVLTVGRALGRRELDGLSLTSCSEQYAVDLVASVDLGGTGQQSADDLALADYAAAETVIRADPTLGLSGTIQALPTGEFELMEQADENGRHAAVRFSVQVYAQTS